MRIYEMKMTGGDLDDKIWGSDDDNYDVDGEKRMKWRRLSPIVQKKRFFVHCDRYLVIVSLHWSV